jgi:nucleoside-diphosphate-sugar epimerase
MMETMLVTGGAGFIGAHLVERLVREGRQVRVFDNFASGRRENLAAVAADVEIVAGDVRDADAVARAARGCEVVFHQAAEVSVPRSLADPRATYAVNVAGTLNVLLAARDAGCRRVVMASSSAVYGSAPELPKREAMAPAPISPYAASKLADEQLGAVFAASYGLETVALRYFNVYGPRQDPASRYAAAIPRFIEALASGARPIVYGDGEQTRDFVFVADVVEANLRAARAAGVAGEAFNVATGRSVTLNAVLRILADLLGTPALPDYRPARPGDIRHSAADVSQARGRLGFLAKIGLADGLAQTVKASRRVPAAA